ncbi:hypothetical protein CSW23_01200 [Thermus scotoductus]|uniref:Uncharacterized protein n=1 Tax=Thermus scotoductus TaxID=37636 RepID=A0A430V6J2_THESC|nr:hypothetical protein CSW50_10545 [Thermus scotoductus]RTI20615.1 hypothetical protein CSW23_01200 [Thermus scotoductus]
MQVKGRVSPQGLILPRQILTDTGGRLLKAFVHPEGGHDKWGGKTLLLGMDPKVLTGKQPWGWRFRGWPIPTRGCGRRCRIPREGGFKPLPKRWVVKGPLPG